MSSPNATSPDTGAGAGAGIGLPFDPSTLPPLDLYSLTGTWIATMLYGMNIIFYFSCIYILTIKQSIRSPGQLALATTSTILFVLATLYIGASLRQLIEAYIDAPKTGIPFAGVMYWLSYTTVLQRIKGYTYVLIDTMQDLVLVWRLYVIWNDNWLVTIIPLCLEAAHFGIAMFETVRSTGSDNGVNFQSDLPLVAYILVIIINTGTTLGIAGRLWYMGRRSAATYIGSYSSNGTLSVNRYMAPIFTIVESGAIFTCSTIVLLAMFVRKDPKLMTAVNVATQLAALVPFLIIVRVGFGLTHTLKVKRGPGNSRQSNYYTSSTSQSTSTPSRPGPTSINILRTTQYETDSFNTSSRNVNFDPRYSKEDGTATTMTMEEGAEYPMEYISFSENAEVKKVEAERERRERERRKEKGGFVGGEAV